MEKEIESILIAISQKANNLEEICCGVRYVKEYYTSSDSRVALIKEIECQLGYFVEELQKLKHI